MTFSQAVRTTLIDKLFDFSGRAPRSEYWWFSAFQIVVIGIIPMMIFASFAETFTDFEGENTDLGDRFDLALDIGFYILTVPYVTVSVRRFHDLNLSGWWFIAIFLFSLPVEFNETNETYLYLSLISAIIPTLICIAKGTDGPNRFGPDPLKPDHTSVFE